MKCEVMYEIKKSEWDNGFATLKYKYLYNQYNFT